MPKDKYFENKAELLLAGGIMCYIAYQLVNMPKRENMGVAWHPRIQLKDIRQSIDGSYRSPIDIENEEKAKNPGQSDLETPVFAYFDVGNRYVNAREVDSMYTDFTDSIGDPNNLHKTFQNSNDTFFANQHQLLIKRGKNAV